MGVTTMRAPAIGNDHGRVSSESVHLTIDVAVDGEQISGHASDGLGPPTQFSGWLGLMGVLDALLSVAPTQDAAKPGVCVCLGFSTAEDAEAFAASDALHDVLQGHGTAGHRGAGRFTTADCDVPTITIHQQARTAT